MSAFDYERDVQGGTNTWLTPRWILDALGPFDLDPCAHSRWPIAATHYYWPEQDGLWLPWDGRVWCNPPYGDEAKPFVERLALHGNGILLTFARTETEWFRRIWETADAIMFLWPRVKFLTGELVESDSGMAPSILAAFGIQNVNCLREAKARGAIKGALVTGWSA